MMLGFGAIYSLLLLWGTVSKSTAFQPIAPEICGLEWQTKYFEMHKQAMENRYPNPKFLISVPVRAGGADNLTGMISLFLYALLTDRVFLKVILDKEYTHAPILDYSYAPATFNWTSPPINQSLYNCLTPPYDHTIAQRPCQITPESKLFDTDEKPRSMVSFFMVNGFLEDKFWRGDIRTDFPHTHDSDREVIFTNSNRGNTWKMFSNPHHNETLKSWGLHPETAFSCFWNYLFALKSDSCDTLPECPSVRDKLLAAQNNPKYKIISIQSRHMGGQADGHFSCADELDKEYQSQGFQTLFILITASTKLQTWALEKYGPEKLLLPSGSVSRPPDVLEESVLPGAQDQAKRLSMLLSSRDMYLSSLADVHVVSARSGFGLMGGLARVRTKDQYLLYRIGREHGDSDLRKCGLSSPDDLGTYADEWSGF